jgi:YbbR domain-containing protein
MADDSIRAFKGKSSFNFRSEWKIFAWCFIIAAILWVLTALNEQFSSSISIKARYINYPKDKVFIKPLPEEFKVMVTAKGWDLIGQHFRKNSEFITIDLNDYKKTEVLITRRLQDNFQQLMAQKIIIGDVFPETISLQKEEKESKKVPVHLNQEIVCKNQYGLGGEVSFSPDSITISGPASVIKGIDRVETEISSLKDLDKPSAIDVRLKDPEFKNINYSVNTVKVQIPVYQLIEQKTEVQLEILNLKNDPGIKLIPSKVSVIYQAPINKYAQMDSVQFQVMVDGSQIDTLAKQPLKVQLVSTPKYTYNLQLKPDYVDYVINK